MNGFNLITGNQIIAELFSDFNISNTDWVGKAERYMARGLSLMKIDGFYEKAIMKVGVNEYRAPLPCDNKYILAVLTVENNSICRLPLTRSLSLGKEFSGLRLHSLHQANIDKGYLHTTFETGTIAYVYYRLPLNDEGNLLIPDNDFVLEALPFYIIYRLSLSGYKHPVISMQMAEDKWRTLHVQARNHVNFPSLEEMESFTQMNTNPLFKEVINTDWMRDYMTNNNTIIDISVAELAEQINRIRNN